MSQQKPRFWYRFLRPLRDTTIPISSHVDSGTLPEIKIITENDLKLEHIIMKEFKYRGECLKQVTSDFTSTLNLYFLFFGISFSGIGILYQLTGGLPGGLQTNLQIIEILIFLALGITSSLFFVRFIALVHINMRHKACMNAIRKYYIKHLQSEISDIGYVFRISLDDGVYMKYRMILFTVFAFVDSLCFAGAAFVFAETRLGIRSNTVLYLPSDLRLYIFGLLISAIVFLTHIIFIRITVFRYQKQLQVILVKEKSI